MRDVKPYRILYLIIIVSILLVVIPAAPVQADGAITLSHEEGKIGDLVTVKGEGFNKSTAKIDKYAAIFFSSDEATTADEIDAEVTHYKVIDNGVWLDELGEFEVTFNVPDELDDGRMDEDVTNGTYYVYVCHYIGTVLQKRIRAVATFNLVRGEILINPEKGPVDTLVEITGKDFTDNEKINIKYEGDEIDIEDGDLETDRYGEFASIVRIPESAAGTHNITIAIESIQVEAEFTVESDLILDRQSGESNTEITISGTGFDKMKIVNIFFHNIKVATETATVLGSFHINFDVPEFKADIYDLYAEDGVNTCKAIFTIIVPPECLLGLFQD